MRNLCLILAAIVAFSLPPALAAGGEKGDFEIGLFAGAGFPDEYGRTVARLDLDDAALYGVRFGYFFKPKWSIELSGQRMQSETRFDPILSTADVDTDIDSVRLNLLRSYRLGKKVRPFFTFGGGAETVDVEGAFDESDPGYNVGGGLRWFVGDNFGLRFDSRFVTTNVGGPVASRQQNAEASVGVLWSFGGKPPGDADGDGVHDRRDRCPDTPRGASVDESGCPLDGDGDGVPDGLDRCPGTKPGVPVGAGGCPLDSDGDGVHDGIDKCPQTPRGAGVDASGCPKDRDADGVFDGIDKCPDTPKGARVDRSGCPQDADRDGVFDGIDKCPDTPDGALVDAAGCPKDTDADGVFDGIDKCPGTPRGTRVDVKGCKALFDQSRRTLVLDGVNFEYNSAVLTGRARGILDRVALSLNEWSEIRIEIGGHTDSRGNDAYNLRLSTRRADAVRGYLESKGVAANRMTSRGYGEGRPLADNATDEGRSKNRRVELKKLD